MSKRGFPDWGDNEASITIPSRDNNELAVRLGALSRFERSGNTLFFDDGSKYLYPYSVVQPNAGSIYRKAYANCISGSAIIVDTDSPASNSGSFTLNVPYSRIAKVGIEFLFDMSTQTPGTKPSIGLDVVVYNNNYAWMYQFFIDFINLRMQINKSNPGGFGPVNIYDSLLNGYYYFGTTRWNHIKLIVNPLENCYQSIVLNGNYLDLSNWLVSKSLSNSVNRIYANWYLTAGVGNFEYMFSDIIVTLDEIYRRE